MNNIETRLIDFLEQECKGEENAVPKNWLANFFNMSTRELRRLKSDIVLKYKVPIGSTTGGYFFAKDDFEIMHIRNEYVSRIRKHSKMVRAYEYMVAHKDQMQII